MGEHKNLDDFKDISGGFCDTTITNKNTKANTNVETGNISGIKIGHEASLNVQNNTVGGNLDIKQLLETRLGNLGFKTGDAKGTTNLNSD